MQFCCVNWLVRCAIAVTWVGFFSWPTQAAFNSIFIFGDSVSDTTTNPGAGPLYYGQRYANGRVWIEVLAERQGLGNNSTTNVNWLYSTNNLSYFGHYSPNLVTNVSRFSPPPDATNALFVVWVNDADFVGNLNDPTFQPYDASNLGKWTNAINRSLSNHLAAIQTLYTKGARTLVMPTAVDITEIPEYTLILSSADKSFIRQRVVDFNRGFVLVTSNAMASLPGLRIVVPDIFSLLDSILANPADYGLTNALYNGQSIDAVEDPLLSDKSLNGPGARYIFWDYETPTSKAQTVMADVVQQLLAPAQITRLTILNVSNRLEVANLPIGLNGFVNGCPNLPTAGWASDQTITSTSSIQSIFVPASGSSRFYRLSFPRHWIWP